MSAEAGMRAPGLNLPERSRSTPGRMAPGLAMPLALILLAVAVFASLAIGPVTVPLGDLATVLGRLLAGNTARDSGAAVVVLVLIVHLTILYVLTGA
jgi:hypothetical protein